MRKKATKKRAYGMNKKPIGAIVLRPKNPALRRLVDRKLAKLKKAGKPMTMSDFAEQAIRRAC